MLSSINLIDSYFIDALSFISDNSLTVFADLPFSVYKPSCHVLNIEP